MLLAGPRGTGKTTLAAALAAEWLREEDEIARSAELRARWGGVPCRTVVYLKAVDLVSSLKGLYGEWGTVSLERMQRLQAWYVAVDLLVVDELSEVPDAHKHKDSILTDVLDKRYAAKRNTLLITNQTIEEFDETMNPSILSRLDEHGGSVECDWASFREEGARK